MDDMTRCTELVRGATLAAFAIMICASSALAHCFPDQMIPSEASALAAAPPQVVMHFDNQFNPAESSVRVLNEKGDVVSGPGTPSADARTITAPLKWLAPGQYFVKWRATSKDGDHTLGAYSFTVKGAR
jgi:methionine-rich copper-binding protein CopC